MKRAIAHGLPGTSEYGRIPMFGEITRLMTRHELKYQVSATENRRIMLRQFAFSPKLLACIAAVIAVSVWLFVTGDRSFAVLLVLAVAGGYTGLTVAVLHNANQAWRAEPKTLTFDSEQVSASGPGGSSSLPWTAFSRCWSDSRYYYLALSRGGVIWLPRAAFSQEQSVSFLEYARQIIAEPSAGPNERERGQAH